MPFPVPEGVTREDLDRVRTNTARDPFGALQLRELHWTLHQGQSGAGEFRTAPRSGYAAVRDIPRHLDDLQRFIGGVNWSETSPDQFVDAISQTYAYLEQSMPFEYGNQDTMLAFVDQVADRSPYTIRHDRHLADGLAAGSTSASESLRNYPPDPRIWKQHFEDRVQFRPAGPDAEAALAHARHGQVPYLRPNRHTPGAGRASAAPDAAVTVPLRRFGPQGPGR